jgi:biopolymer transport protein ExbB/biopolymer transport protein TolQ
MASAGAGLASISAGISEALITTAFGILVAVVGVWCFNFFTSRIEKVTEELASSEADFIAWAMKLVQARHDAAAAK